MSLRLLQKTCGGVSAESSSESKAVTQPQSRLSGRGRGAGSGQGSGGYYGGHGGQSYSGGSAPLDSGYGNERTVLAPCPARFHGTSEQAAHVNAVRAATSASSSGVAKPVVSDLAVKSGLGLDAVREKKQKEEDERQAKREAARARRLGEVAKKDVDDERMLIECEEQARQDSEQDERVKYEAALVVRIAIRFGAAGAWTKIAEARARGAAIPLDARKMFLLAHPDRCRLPEATDATAILNSQRPPEMTEARAKPSAAGMASSPASVPSPSHEVSESAQSTVVPRRDEVAEPAPPSVSNVEPHASAVVDDGAQRIDPYDNQACTLQDLREKYKGVYQPAEIDEYWASECKPQAKPQAKPTARPGSRRY